MELKTKRQSIVGMVYGGRGGWIVIARDAMGDHLPSGGCHGSPCVATAALLSAESGNGSFLTLYCWHKIAKCILFLPDSFNFFLNEVTAFLHEVFKDHVRLNSSPILGVS